MNGSASPLAALASLAVLTCASAAAAQDPVSLSCQGTFNSTGEFGSRLSSDLDDYRTAARAGTVTSRTQRSPARLNLLVGDGAVKVRPFGQMRPDRSSADGWYALSNVTVTDEQIVGTAPYGAEKLTLVVDRRSGDVRFGGFDGRCAKPKL